MAEDSSEIVREATEAASANLIAASGSVAFVNTKALGEGNALVNNMAAQDMLEARSGWRSINQAIVGKVAEGIINTSPAEGGADVAALMQLAKMGAITPPITANPIGGST